MDYKDIAVINERRLKGENDNLRQVLQQTSDLCIRYKTMLYNALVLLAESNDTYILDDLGMSEEEYNEIMGE